MQTPDEPRSVVRGSSFEAQRPSFTDHGLAATDHGPGLLWTFPYQIWTLLEGVGPQDAGACVSEGRYFDWLAGLKVNVSVLH